MKLVKKYWKTIIALTLIVFLSIYVCGFAIKKVRNYQIYSKPIINTKIYSIWHVETFEGGGKSRLTYLKNLATKIEKENVGILFHIQQIEPEKLEAKISDSSPDILSFGFGVGKIILPHLINQKHTFSVQDKYVESGCFSGKVYALPYIVAGYVICSHSDKNTETIYGKNAYTTPKNTTNLTAYPSQYEAYKKFANNKKVNLVGTTRDLFRVNNLNNIGRTTATITPLDDYTDLIQYIASTKSDEIIDKFISSLLGNEYQAKLTEYSLFSSLSTPIYSSGIYKDMENAILNAEIPKVFD